MQQLPTNGRHQCYWLSFLPPAGCCVCSAYRDVLSANASSLVLVLFSITLSSCLYTSGIFYFFYFYCYFLFFFSRLLPVFGLALLTVPQRVQQNIDVIGDVPVPPYFLLLRHQSRLLFKVGKLPRLKPTQQRFTCERGFKLYSSFVTLRLKRANEPDDPNRVARFTFKYTGY